MASSRAMRKSPRTASPLNAPTNGRLTPEVKTIVQNGLSPGDTVWTEPPLRAPVPSFEDHKGLERHGVLEHMAPLGTMPNQKSKLRVKHFEPSRKNAQGKHGDAAASDKEAMKAQESSENKRRSESRKAEEKPSKLAASTRERDEDQDYTPKSLVTRAPVLKPVPTRISAASTPSSKTTAGQERLRQVVESAVQRSKELGNEILGLAVRKLFEESLQNRTLADLLDAVLSQRPTQRQAADFQAYIKIARKQIKSESGQSRRSSAAGIAPSSTSTPKSPPKGTGPSIARDSETPMDKNEAAHAYGKNNVAQPSQFSEKDEEPQPQDEHRAKRVKRSRSVSSTSTLSSLSSNESVMELEQEQENTVEDSSATPSRGESKSQASAGPKLHTFSTKTVPHGTKRTSSMAARSTPEAPSTEDLSSKRRKLERSFDDYTVKDSNIRTNTALNRPSAPLPERLSTSPQKPTGGVGAMRVGLRDDCDNLRSPASSTQEFLIPPPPGVQRRSRGATPNPSSRSRNGNGRKVARIKISPVKKRNGGVVAGIARTGGGRDSPIGYEDDNEDVDNVDYCSACGGNGELLCCDGCTRSFHFRCLDPPMNADQLLDGEWFCYVCEGKRTQHPKPPRGLFAAMFVRLSKQNPVAYNLPPVIREYFEGVKTGEEGEYEEISTLKSRGRGTGGYDELQDNFKLKDAKGNVVLCFKCGKSSLGHREIIACDYCSLRWHLDCLDPPMANPPIKDYLNRPKYSWMCPNHVDQELLTCKHSAHGRVHKIRRPKNARIVDTALRRGFKNNGIIEIENEPPEDEGEVIEETGSSVVFRVQERGIKLDFIDRVKSSRPPMRASKSPGRQAQSLRSGDGSPRRVSNEAEQNRVFNARSFLDQQAASNLLHFARFNPDLGLKTDHVQSLVATLISEAPDAVVAMCGDEGFKDSTTTVDRDPSIPPTPPISDLQDLKDLKMSAKERKQLLMLQELVRRRLLHDSDIATVDSEI